MSEVAEGYLIFFGSLGFMVLCWVGSLVLGYWGRRREQVIRQQIDESGLLEDEKYLSPSAEKELRDIYVEEHGSYNFSGLAVWGALISVVGMVLGLSIVFGWI